MPEMARIGHIGIVVLVACGASGVDVADPEDDAPAVEERVTDPRARAERGGWTGAALHPPPHYCNDEGGTEWCEGEHDDDCDGVIDEGCADCVARECVRFEIPEAETRRGGVGRCVGPIYCGRIDGRATTSPPGGCGTPHCGTVVWPDRSAQPNHCTVFGRCVGGEFVAEGFTW